MKQIKSIREMQEIELNILKKVHSFCIENGIKYYLTYGTLIGAIRHDGFIPWDDDIDIIMLRDQYDRFLRLFPEKADEMGLFLASPYSSDHYYPHEYSKVCDSSTILIERMSKIDSNLGVYIDVFPLDNVPDGKIQSRIFHLKTRLFRRLLNAANTNLSTDDYTKHYNASKQVMIKLLHAVPIRWTFNRYEKMVHQYKCKKSRYVMQLESDSGAIHEKNWFNKTILHKFEDGEFCIPEQYDPFLRHLYGDYMKLPPADQQIPHHVIDVWMKGETK